MKLPSAERRWSTWNAARPAEMLYLPQGISLAPFAYAASTGRFTWFPPGPECVLGPHTIHATHVDLSLRHAGTTLAWSYRKDGTGTVIGEWSAVDRGEWGLRFWPCLCFSARDGAQWRYDDRIGLLRAECDGTFVAVASQHAPLLVTGHSGPSGLEEEFSKHGYWYLKSRARESAFIVLRFNLEEMPGNRFAIAVADASEDADRRALAALDAELPPSPPPDGRSAAVRDIMAWNTVWDPVNLRPYTTCSRSWDLGKFGGYGIWLTDTGINALLHASFGDDQAWENLEALASAQTEAGNFPCLVTGNDAWMDRSQPPLISLVVWLIYRRTLSRPLLERFYEPLVRNHRWWWRSRDGNGNGILEYGSSDVGDGLYVGTKLAAKNESFMDNSPVHDEARWQASARTLDCEDVGLNSLIAVDSEMLSMMASELGRDEDASEFAARAANHRTLISEHFWDSSRGIFANRLWSGAFVRSLAPTSFLPLLAGAATAQQARALLKALEDPRMFGGKVGLPSVARRDPAFRDNVYWRGRVWPILNWLVWMGLKRTGFHPQADALAAKGESLFEKSWSRRLAPENFNSTSGQGMDQPDTDPFYSWTALLPYMGVSRHVDFDAWQGWCLVNRGETASVGPMRTPAGTVTLRKAHGTCALLRDGVAIFETTVKGRLSSLSIGPQRIAFTLPGGLKSGGVLRLAAPVSLASQNDRMLAIRREKDQSVITLSPSREPEDVVVILR